jgi:histidine triad (HIT) family protein
MGDSCAVCDKHRTLETLPGGFIYRDSHVFIAHFPLLKGERAHRGHIILEMSRHITKPSEMTPEEGTSVGQWIPKLSRSLEKVLGAEHVYLVRIGDKTPHLHFHFVPRYPGTPKEFWGPLLNTFANSAPDVGATEMAEITDKIKRFLEDTF